MRRRCVLLAALSLVALGSCGGTDVEELTSALATVDPPVGALENPIEPGDTYQGGELVEIVGCCPAFVYRPDDAHPDGWTGGGDTLVIRYFELVDLADADAACRAYLDWVESNDPSQSPTCDVSAPTANGTSHFGLAGVEARGGDVVLGGQIAVSSAGASAVFAAVAAG